MAKITSGIAPTLAVVDGKVTTTSTDVAKHFGKRHDNVVRDIESLVSQLPPEALLNFEEGYYTLSATGEQQHKQYTITRDGFTLLAMGFTGKKALAFKLAYIDAFNRMEVQLQQPPALPAPAHTTTQVGDALALGWAIGGLVQQEVTRAVLAGGDKWKHQRWSLSFITDSKFGSPPVVERWEHDQGLFRWCELHDLIGDPSSMVSSEVLAKIVNAGVARLASRAQGQQHTPSVPAPRPCSALNYSSARLQTTPRQKVLEFIAQAGPAGVSRRELVQGCRAYRALDHAQRALLLEKLLQNQAIYTKPTPTGRSEVLVCATHLVTP